ncbi:MAG: hypothetical protein WD690_05865 [Vicinamibacterales bacterium]
MTGFLRAWAWLRWRTFMNAIERSERADRLARFSRAIEALGPVVVAVMMIPAAIMALLFGMATGYGLGSGEMWGVPLMHAMRIALFVVIIFTVMGPIVLPSGRGIASLPRLLLLPVPHKALFAGELLGGLAEPWTLLGAIAVVMVAVGALMAGHVALAVVAAAAAVALVMALLAIGALCGALLHVLMRDRKRGEWIVVLFFTLLPLAAIAPALIAGAGVRGDDWEEQFEARAEAMLEQPGNGALALFPGELFVAAAARTTGVSPGSVAIPIAGLALMTTASVMGGWTLWKRTIDRGGIARGRSKAATAGAGLPSSLGMMKTPRRAIAFTFLQHVVRTARGRTTVLPAIIMTVVFAGLVGVKGGVVIGAIPLRDGFAIGVFGMVMAFLTVVQLWMNQFAIDRAGLTMLCVQPLTSAQILRGKMAGTALLVAVLAALPFGAGLLVGTPRPVAYWLVLVLGSIAAFLVIAPFAVILSAVFPKHVDLASIGQKSNAHAAAGFLGMLVIFGSAAPGIGAALFGFRIMQSHSAAMGLTALWLLVAIALHWALWRLAVATFERRRESLIAVANGR